MAAGGDAQRTSRFLVLTGAVLVVFFLGIVHCIAKLPDHKSPREREDFLRRIPDQRPSLRRGIEGGQSLASAQGFNPNNSSGSGETGLISLTSDGSPDGSWPISVSPDSEEYEEIIHPADPDVSMFVPQFWSAPLDRDGSRFSRGRARQIGTCTSASVGRNHARGTECPPDERTIFVSLASYRDYHCRITLESIFSRAAHPERIRVAVVDQTKEGDIPCSIPTTPCNRDPKQVLCKHREQIDVYQMAAELAVGPVFARHICNRFYRGEFYAMQMDAQVLFAMDWDRNIIQQHDLTEDEMAVLSSSLTSAEIGLNSAGEALTTDRPVVCETHFYGRGDLIHLDTGSQPDFKPMKVGFPELQPFWSAAFSFGRGHFLVNVPYDMYQPMIFSGEEISMTVRAFSMGYDFFSLGKSVCFHVFATGENKEKRKSVPLFWENENHYEEIDEDLSDNSMKRLIGIIKMTDLNVHAWNHVGNMYGLGKARDVSRFF
mmetsp:Transcript_27419/g.80644  ORF Transcript_27419/g.80644 Transcript_27419/m.80644 type:complete len:488 (-) Transcript_27419:360-1823(-)